MANSAPTAQQSNDRLIVAWEKATDRMNHTENQLLTVYGIYVTGIFFLFKDYAPSSAPNATNMSLALFFCVVSLGIQHISRILDLNVSTLLELERKMPEVDVFQSQLRRGGKAFLAFRLCMNHVAPVLLALLVFLTLAPQRGMDVAWWIHWLVGTTLFGIMTCMFISAARKLELEFRAETAR